MPTKLRRLLCLNRLELGVEPHDDTFHLRAPSSEAVSKAQETILFTSTSQEREAWKAFQESPETEKRRKLDEKQSDLGRETL